MKAMHLVRAHTEGRRRTGMAFHTKCRCLRRGLSGAITKQMAWPATRPALLGNFYGGQRVWGGNNHVENGNRILSDGQVYEYGSRDVPWWVVGAAIVTGGSGLVTSKCVAADDKDKGKDEKDKPGNWLRSGDVNSRNQAYASARLDSKLYPQSGSFPVDRLNLIIYLKNWKAWFCEQNSINPRTLAPIVTVDAGRKDGTVKVSFRISSFRKPLVNAAVASFVERIAQQDGLHIVKSETPVQAGESGKTATAMAPSSGDQTKGAKIEMVFDNGEGSVVFNLDESIQLFKDGGLNEEEFAALHDLWIVLLETETLFRTTIDGLRGGARAKRSAGKSSAVSRLEDLGATVHVPRMERPDSESDEVSTQESKLDWDCLAGYDHVKKKIQDTILLSLEHPDEYEKVTNETRARKENNRPRAILFEGPPGTGKTTTARILSNVAGIPMVYIPVEAIMSKYYGDSAKRLSQMFKLSEELGQCIIFLDEIDSLATRRGLNSMHEATRRILSVLLRSLDGFNSSNQTSVLIAATNRRDDLDPALISRFNFSIFFDLPSLEARISIYKCYAKHLSPNELEILGVESQGFSGRDIKDVCSMAERTWTSHRIQKKDPSISIAPPLQAYQEAIEERKQSTAHSSSHPFHHDPSSAI